VFDGKKPRKCVLCLARRCSDANRFAVIQLMVHTWVLSCVDPLLPCPSRL